MMRHDKHGNIIPEVTIESNRKFYGVPVVITSTIWESGIQIFEADSPEEALKMYQSDIETPLDIDYTGWQDQEYQYDELDTGVEDDVSAIELIPNKQADIQWILQRDAEREADRLLEEEKGLGGEA
jgi:hypothetical protein